MTLISIITPSYNQAEFIEETINSIWSQEGDFKIEHIIIDGLSTDGTQKILKKYEKKLKLKKYPIKCKGLKFFWKSEKDSGQTEAINKGFKKATGNILAYLNSDDLYSKNAFNIVNKVFKSNKNINMIYGKCVLINQQSQKIGMLESRKFDLFYYLNDENFIPQPTVFIKKGVYQSIGKFNENYNYAMDYDYYLRVVKKFNVKFLKNYTIAKFRIHPKSKSEINKKKSWKEARRIQIRHGGDFFSIAYSRDCRIKLIKRFSKIGIDLNKYFLLFSKIRQKNY